MSGAPTVPDGNHADPEVLVGRVDDADTIYFVLSVGNADTQLLLLPVRNGTRRAVIVDVGTARKLPALIGSLAEAGLFPDHSRIALVVATHPHRDHIGGLPDLLRRYGTLVDEFWDPAYRVGIGSYVRTMSYLEDHPDILVTHPTAGTQRLYQDTLITALGPSQLTRSRFDTFGVNPNNASLALKVEFPMRRAFDAELDPAVGRVYQPLKRSGQSLLLGADAQTDAWATVTTDFPRIDDTAPMKEALADLIASEPLRSNVFKVPHHGSKHGLNLELAERIHPSFSFVSCAAGANTHGFPHTVSLDALREAVQATTSKGARRLPDWQLGIHYTGSREAGSRRPLGTIGMVMSPTGRKRLLFRFGDTANERVDLNNARLYIGPTKPR